MSESIRNQRLLALFACGWSLLNFPLLTLWDRGASVAGIPLLPAALFGGWTLLIVAVAWIAESGPEDSGQP
jgi:hypothetical protein